MVLPSRCGGASASHSSGRVTRMYNINLASNSWHLGSSSFGTVLRAARRDTQEVRAARAILKRRCDRERLLHELGVLKGLDHPNLPRVHEIVEDARVIWLIMEMAQGQELMS